MKKSIKIVEVGARDGLQNESSMFTVNDRYQLIKKLSQTGLKNIEVGAFVSSKWVPQMEGSKKLVNRVLKDQSSGKLDKKVQFSALVPNVRGMQDALTTEISEIAIFGSCSESFSQKNINCSIDESFNRFYDVVQLAKKNKVRVRGYLSMSFGCPYEGKISQSKVVSLTEKMIAMGVQEVSIGDTIGVGTPKQVISLLRKMEKKVPLKKVAMHFHDTRGTALANVLASLQSGISVFDSSVAGLGGCPYAKGASGNLATEDLVYMLDGMGLKCGVDVDGLVEIHKWLRSKIDHPLPSHVGRSGRPGIPVL